MVRETKRTKDVKDIRTWPPGTFILIDTREVAKTLKGLSMLTPKIEPFVGLGMVVANDGKSQIRVIWGANCKEAYKEYNVDDLSRQTIFCVE